MLGVRALIRRSLAVVALTVLALGSPAAGASDGASTAAPLDLSTSSSQSLAPPTNDPFALGKAAYENRDYADAMHWFRVAADAGRSAGMAGIGVLYGLALGV